ncbi:hypothetical protein [Streptomyces sp. NPDC002205]|uniref:hypothetical protein n=1 Tax=Streptomyces sp. NPDC002205 TaxID=3154411 RepID=UPI003319CCC1
MGIDDSMAGCGAVNEVEGHSGSLDPASGLRSRSTDAHRALLEAIGVDDETPVWRLREPLRWKGTMRDSAKTLA